MDPITAGALIAGGSALIGNIGARGEAKKARKFNQTEAQKERQFQQSMSSSAHQRQVRDLKKAGLNPILGISSSGASTPSGASASTTATELQDPVKAALTSAMEVKALQLQMEKQKAENKLLASNTKKSDMETLVMSKSIPRAEITNDIYGLAKPILGKIKDSYRTNSLENWGNARRNAEIDRLNDIVRKERLKNLGRQPSINLGRPK